MSVKSMTGFGRSRVSGGAFEVTVEIKTLNHRFLDVNVRLPKYYAMFEPEIRRLISERVSRGKFEVSITRVGDKGGVLEIGLDMALAHSCYQAVHALKSELGLAGEITVSDMLVFKELVQMQEKEISTQDEWPVLESCTKSALDVLDAMREAEGHTLWEDIRGRLGNIESNVHKTEPLAHQVKHAARDRLAKRIQELTGGLGLDQDRLATEAAIIADRMDVTEEITRLKSHIEQFLLIGEKGSPLGRKLDFLLQEMHREINTLGTKAVSTEISPSVVDMKAELEKIREQTQNIE